MSYKERQIKFQIQLMLFLYCKPSTNNCIHDHKFFLNNKWSIIYRLKQQQNTKTFRHYQNMIKTKIDKLSNSIYVLIII